MYPIWGQSPTTAHNSETELAMTFSIENLTACCFVCVYIYVYVCVCVCVCVLQSGLTPLHLAAQEDQVSVAEVLLNHGAGADVRTKVRG